jgi:hypothetical protein
LSHSFFAAETKKSKKKVESRFFSTFRNTGKIKRRDIFLGGGLSKDIGMNKKYEFKVMKETKWKWQKIITAQCCKTFEVFNLTLWNFKH